METRLSNLRIVMVADVSPLVVQGGAGRVLWEQASRLVKLGHDVRVVSRAPDGAAAEVVERQGVVVHQFAAPRASVARFVTAAVLAARRTALEVLAERPADVLHVYQPLAGFGVLSSRAGRRVPSLYTFLSPAPLEYRSRRGMTPRHLGGAPGLAGGWLLARCEAACVRRATRFHVLSDFSAGQLWSLYGVSREEIVRIPGGADLEEFQPADAADARRELGLPADRPILFTVRNLESRMGLDLLIQAMARLRSDVPTVLLLIAGTGSRAAELRALSASLGLSGHVRFVGRVPDDVLPCYYQAADAFVLPSRELEGFGLVTVEALASGIPVLATPVGATPEILAPLDGSLLFREATVDAITDGLRDFLERRRRDPLGIDRLRGACRTHALTNYSWTASVAALEVELRRLAAGASASPSAPASEDCLVCAGPTRLTPLVYRGERYRRCPRCETSVLARLPAAADLRARYEHEYPRRYPHHVIAAGRQAMLSSLVERLPAPTGRLVDVGAAGGHLVGAARTRGWRPVAIDLSHDACVSARELSGCAGVQADAVALPLRDGSAAVVTLVNVLDHLTTPMAALREAHRVLVPGGHLVVRIPNAAVHLPCAVLFGALGRPARRLGWDRLPILHIVGLTARGIRAGLEATGFRVIEIRSSPASGADNRSLAGVVRAFARAIALVSSGRWLAAPSLEVLARREPAHRDGPTGDVRC